MRKIFITFFVLIFVFTCQAQNTTLNDTELFEGIKFNNVSLGEIMRSKGDLTTMQDLFGNQIQELPNNTGPFLGKVLFSDNISFSFEDESDTGNDYMLKAVRVKNSSVVTQVKGLSVRIGDDRMKFGQFPFNANSSSYNFIDDLGSSSLSFKIDVSSNKVIEINYISF